jgi:nucleoside 2-deoxyribosyltransferase
MKCNRTASRFIVLAIALILGTSVAHSNPRPIRIYLANPLGFSQGGTYFKNEVLIPKLEHLGYQVIDPWNSAYTAQASAVAQLPYGTDRRDKWAALNPKIGAQNASNIRNADMVVAVLDGTDVDSGTAAEVGFAYALGKPIVGYRGDFRLASDNEGSVVNLQVERFIRQSGGSIVTGLAALPAAIALAANHMRPQFANRRVEGGLPSDAIPDDGAPQQGILDVITFFERVFGIVLALALGEAFKQSVSEDEGRVVRWENLWALASFLLLIILFQGMNRYFYLTYGSMARLPHPYAPYLLFDGAAFILESAIFFVMSRALTFQRWKQFYCWVVCLLCLDTVWGAVAYFGHSSDVGRWLVLNLVFVLVVSVMLLLFWRRSAKEAAVVFTLAMGLRTLLDYWLMWNFYFPLS